MNFFGLKYGIFLGSLMSVSGLYALKFLEKDISMMYLGNFYTILF